MLPPVSASSGPPASGPDSVSVEPCAVWSSTYNDRDTIGYSLWDRIIEQMESARDVAALMATCRALQARGTVAAPSAYAAARAGALNRQVHGRQAATSLPPGTAQVTLIAKAINDCPPRLLAEAGWLEVDPARMRGNPRHLEQIPKLTVESMANFGRLTGLTSLEFHQIWLAPSFWELTFSLPRLIRLSCSQARLPVLPSPQAWPRLSALCLQRTSGLTSLRLAGPYLPGLTHLDLAASGQIRSLSGLAETRSGLAYLDLRGTRIAIDELGIKLCEFDALVSLHGTRDMQAPLPHDFLGAFTAVGAAT